METHPAPSPMDRAAVPGGRRAPQGSAAITHVAATPSGVSAAAAASYEAGIGRVDFVLIDLASDPSANVVDRKDVDYGKPPQHVTEAWASSVSLSPELAYRVLFRVYERTGVNLVAYDRRDFSLRPEGVT